MQCIVMMGGDDIQLEPGELVELVKVETSGGYRVRTTDENPIEGVVSPLFLRSRDSVRGSGMESKTSVLFFSGWLLHGIIPSPSVSLSLSLHLYLSLSLSLSFSLSHTPSFLSYLLFYLY